MHPNTFTCSLEEEVEPCLVDPAENQEIHERLEENSLDGTRSWRGRSSIRQRLGSDIMFTCEIEFGGRQVKFSIYVHSTVFPQLLAYFEQVPISLNRLRDP